MDYEERIKYRDNEFLYEKCCKQYNVLMEYQHKMRDYKQQIKTLEEENKKLKEKVVELSNHLSLYSSLYVPSKQSSVHSLLAGIILLSSHQITNTN